MLATRPQSAELIARFDALETDTRERERAA